MMWMNVPLAIILAVMLSLTMTRAISDEEDLLTDLSDLTTCLGPVLSKNLVFPNSSDYNVLSSGQRPRVSGSPLSIFLASDLDQVSPVVKCAYELGIQPIPRSGGHSYEGFSALNDSLVIDLSACDAVKVKRRDGLQLGVIDAGARLGNVYKKLWKQGRYSINAGTCPSIGMGGHISGGGYGMQSRKYGMAADRVIGLKVVLYNGTVIWVTKRKHSDLFWALRGGGSGSFGIVLQYTIKLFRMPSKNSLFLITYNSTNQSQILEKWQSYFPSAVREMNTQLKIFKKHTTLRGHYLGRDTTCSNFTLLDVPRRIAASDKEYRKSKSEYVSDLLSPQGISAVVEGIQNGPPRSWIQLEAFGGIFETQNASMTPFPNRKGTKFSMQYTAYLSPNEPETSANYEWIRWYESTLEPYVNGRHYQNYPDLDLGEDFGEGYFGEDNFNRLQKIKEIYDPEDIFNNPQSIPLPV